MVKVRDVSILQEDFEHTVSENIFSHTKKDTLNITNKKVNFHVSLTKYRSDLLHETNIYVSKNANGKVKFCFADSHGNLETKFFDNKKLVMIRFSRSWRHWMKNLVTEKQNNNLTTTKKVKVMNKSMSESGFFTCLYRFRSIAVFLMVLLIKYICISTFLTNSAA